MYFDQVLWLLSSSFERALAWAIYFDRVSGSRLLNHSGVLLFNHMMSVSTVSVQAANLESRRRSSLAKSLSDTIFVEGTL